MSAKTLAAKGAKKATTQRSGMAARRGFKDRQKVHKAIRARTEFATLTVPVGILNNTHINASVFKAHWNELVAGILAESNAKGSSLDPKKKKAARLALQEWYLEKVKAQSSSDQPA